MNAKTSFEITHRKETGHLAKVKRCLYLEYAPIKKALEHLELQIYNYSRSVKQNFFKPSIARNVSLPKLGWVG